MGFIDNLFHSLVFELENILRSVRLRLSISFLASSLLLVLENGTQAIHRQPVREVRTSFKIFSLCAKVASEWLSRRTAPAESG